MQIESSMLIIRTYLWAFAQVLYFMVDFYLSLAFYIFCLLLYLEFPSAVQENAFVVALSPVHVPRGGGLTSTLL